MIDHVLCYRGSVDIRELLIAVFLQDLDDVGRAGYHSQLAETYHPAQLRRLLRGWGADR